ncbi:hypothetical protein DPMN_090484 [Dreissena polymorpha]|uniref:Uncharacterized protein n=1 Tax=Dreissena polymorpha TaxID=45954 RepID=A0A9D4KYT6_DREPO|nr:hypothetical protein DPMN_090484 [Dreissena polymorpha]
MTALDLDTHAAQFWSLSGGKFWTSPADDIYAIVPVHAFDLPRRRLPGRKKVDHVAKERKDVQKIEVRWKKARTNYSKMLPTK